MPLSFPNASRSYDASRRRIRFWAHDNAIEVSFFIEENALFRMNPDMRNDEASMLSTFDDMRKRIHALAEKAYSFGSRSFYVLQAADV